MPIGDQVDVTELTTVEAVLIQLFPIYYPPPSSHPIHPSIAYLDWHQLTLNRYALALVRPTLNSCHYKQLSAQYQLKHQHISTPILKTGLTSIDMHRHRSRQLVANRRTFVHVIFELVYYTVRPKCLDGARFR